jgi:D-3-phosphoglycerate dehydrogenase
VEGLTLLPPDDVYRRADLISLHMPKVAGTPAAIGREQLKQMKPASSSSIARAAAVVDEAALLEALGNGQVAELPSTCSRSSLRKTFAWSSTPRVIATPHVGASLSRGSPRRLEVRRSLLAEL